MDNNNLPHIRFFNPKSLLKTGFQSSDRLTSCCRGNSSACYWFVTWVSIKVLWLLFPRSWALALSLGAPPPESRNDLPSFLPKDQSERKCI